MQARFNPVDDVLVTCGIHHVKFWTMVGDNQLKAVYAYADVCRRMLTYRMLTYAGWRQPAKVEEGRVWTRRSVARMLTYADVC
jgi:hypothetical protein